MERRFEGLLLHEEHFKAGFHGATPAFPGIASPGIATIELQDDPLCHASSMEKVSGMPLVVGW
jgi:hypothetical protein